MRALHVRSYMRNKKNMSPVFVCDLVLTNVRETLGGARNSFEVTVHPLSCPAHHAAMACFVLLLGLLAAHAYCNIYMGLFVALWRMSVWWGERFVSIGL